MNFQGATRRAFTPLEKATDKVGGDYPTGCPVGLSRACPVRNFISNGVKERGSLTGFTLIELIMTIVVVAIIALPLSVMLSQQVQSTFRSSDYSSALNLARLEMEKVNNLAYDSIASGTFASYEGYPFDVTRTVNFAPGSGVILSESLKQIKVEVRKAGDVTVLAELVTYIARNVNYGSP
ncbi:MAG: prepilin-type N-terminal cleavage/methylation domain-containing protein [Candidatus Omnitrophota bacterium]